MKYMYDFFICYSKTIYDKFVKKFCTLLKQNGLNIWLDQFNVHLGEQIITNLYSVLDSFKTVSCGIILIMDKSFFDKTWCIRELEYIIQNNLSFFPILYYIEKQNIPEKYAVLRNYNMVTIRNRNEDICFATSKVLDAYLQHTTIKATPINEDILATFISSYLNADKTDAYIIVYADNISLYIKAWHKNNHCFINNPTKVAMKVIHLKLMEFYNTSHISDYDINLVCNATDYLINTYGNTFI